MENNLRFQLTLNKYVMKGLQLVALAIATCTLPSVSHGLQKHSIDYSIGQYYPRENGTFELDFLYPNSGAPRYGIADIVPITSKPTVKALELNDQQLGELEKIRNSARETIRALTKDKKNTEEIEQLYKDQVLEILTEKQEKKWDQLNSRAVFFSAGLLNFLKREDVSATLGLNEEQIKSIKVARPKHAAWLKSEINKLYEDAIKKAIKGTSDSTRKRILKLFEFQNREHTAAIGTPSTLHWFFNESNNKVRFDPKLGFVQTTWRINLNSELVCILGTSYYTGMSNLTRFHWYYAQNIANAKQAEIVKQELGFFSLADDGNNFFDRNESGKVPFIEHMEKLFKSSQANQTDESFDRFAFQSIVRNVGLVNALENKVQFKEKPFKRDDIDKIKENSEEVAKLLRDRSAGILSKFLRYQIPGLTAEQSLKLESILIQKADDAKQMSPLELVYLGVAMADADRSNFRSSKSTMSGYQLPDFDLIEAAQAESSKRKIVDKRNPRFTVEKDKDEQKEQKGSGYFNL